MGNKNSNNKPPALESEQETLESLFRSELLSLQRTFAHMAAESGEGCVFRHTLAERLRLVPENVEDSPLAREERLAFDAKNLGKYIVKCAYGDIEKLGWVEFLRGTAACCKEISSVQRLEILVSLFATTAKGIEERKQGEEDRGKSESKEANGGGRQEEEGKAKLEAEAGSEVGEKPGGEGEHVTKTIRILDIEGALSLILTCWLMSCQVQLSLKGEPWAFINQRPGSIRLIDADPLVESLREHVDQARKASGSLHSPPSPTGQDSMEEGESEGEERGCDSFLLEEVVSWAGSTLPGLAECLGDYMGRRLVGDVPTDQAGANQRQKQMEANLAGNGPAPPSPSADVAAPATVPSSTHEVEHPGLLSSSTCWSLGLSQRGGQLADVLLGLGCGPDGWQEFKPKLLYRSSHHGRGVSRFLSHVDGYQGLSLLLLSASTKDQSGADTWRPEGGQRWSLAVVIPTGFSNREVFYGGSGGCLVGLHPRFQPIRALGRESNFVYSYARVPGQGYRSVPKPQGVGFGGSLGKERVWIGEDFGSVTVRHHAVDHTYQHGSLVPGQGYAPVESKLEEMEVWGLAGKTVEEKQIVFQQRESLFKQQRGKIDMKSFAADWGSSPDKMMMDMMSDPSKPAREER